MNRREFLGASLATGATLALGNESSAPTPSPLNSRPNILFIWTDQQAAQAMSCAGNPWVKTPAMDSLAKNGVLFHKAYCCDPICVPSRTSWITGSMPHETGITFNTEHGDINTPPLSKALQENGYDTGYVGKWHIPHRPDDSDWHGFDFVRHARGNKLDPDVLPACNEFLRTKRDSPFFLVASFVNPHDICEWAREATGIDSPLPNGALPGPPPPEDCPPLPENFAIPEGEPEVIRQLKEMAYRTYPTIDWEDKTWRQYLWAYYQLIERVDAQVGSILQTIREIGADSNTLIVFSSDHGDGAASHQWNQKTLFYEESARVPFIVSPPGGSSGSQENHETLVNMNLDFFPTVYDYAGIDQPKGLEGISLRAAIEGTSKQLDREYVVSQNDLAPKYGQTGGVLGRMIRTQRYKYIRFSTGTKREQLFDLEKDPGELEDLTLSDASQSILQAHRQMLDDWMERRNDPFPRG